LRPEDLQLGINAHTFSVLHVKYSAVNKPVSSMRVLG